INGNLDQKGYHKILVHHAVPAGKKLIGQGFIMQQDNDLKHTSKLCKNFLMKKKEKNILKLMEWPPQSKSN
ncbi:hypothetical protein ALC60_08196, partial [Trachymyrmex zeteki]